MKKFLVTIALLGFGFNASADRGLEVQINGGFGNTGGAVSITDKDWNGGASNTSWGLGAEVYKSMSDKLQLGGVLALADSGISGADMAITLGAGVRFNFDTDLRNSMFAGGMLVYNDYGSTDSISLNANFGKRYALSDSITYTPNVTVSMRVGGDRDEGTSIMINLISFSGFM